MDYTDCASCHHAECLCYDCVGRNGGGCGKVCSQDLVDEICEDYCREDII